MSNPRVADAPILLTTKGWADYGLIDSGAGRKLERYGPFKVVRPEPQCLWTPRLPQEEWDRADAVFDPTDEDENGRWQFSSKPPVLFPLSWREAKFNSRFTNFRHLAFFPEQAANWEWLDARIRGSKRQLTILNLFGYTGVASLVAAAAGAKVTHVDASKKSVAWARENAILSKLDEKPVRWLVEDARKYVQRELRRGAQYDGIILDPPKFGRGPTGETWRLFEDLPDLSEMCTQLLSPDASFMLMNAYAARISGASLSGLMADQLKGRGGVIDWGELALEQEDGERRIGLSFFARWSR